MSNLLSQASLVMIPSGYKEDIVYSVIPTSGAGDLSFTRASNGTRINSAGLVEVTPWNMAEYSEDFSNAAWVKSASATTITTNSTTAPNGTTTADTWTINAAGARYVGQTKTVTAGAVTASFFVKKGTSDWFYIRIDDGTNYAGYTFDVATGQLGQSVSSVLTPIASIVDFGNGWYRCIVATTVAVTSITVSGWVATSATTISGLLGASLICWGAQLNIGTTAKPYFPTTDRLNVPRLTYQNGGGGCPSLLLEKQSTNEFVRSEQFDNASWIKGANLSVTANSIVSPDGTQNADTVTNSGANSVYIYQLSQAQGTTWTTSLYAKKGTNKYLGIAITAYSYVNERYQPVFNLDDGTIQAQNTSGTNVSNTSCSITPVGNGWYRITATGTFVAGADYCYAVIQSSNNTNYQPDTATGSLDWTNATNGNAYLWGAQMEASSYSTSYIPTTSSSATRVADECIKTGISSLIGQTEGTIFVDINNQLVNPPLDTRIQLSDGSTNNWIFLGVPDGGTGGLVRCYVLNVATSFNMTFYSSSVLAKQRYKIAFAYKSGSFALYINGVLEGSSSATGTMPSCSALAIGGSTPASITQDSIQQFNEVILFPTRLTNAELASLTTI
jgi:hypothetical protein